MDTDKFVQSKVIQMPIDELKMAQPFCEVFEIRETDLRQVMDAIRKNGFDTLYPIVVWEGHDNVVVDGHTRLIAARQLGYATVPVVSRSFSDEEAALQHTITAQRVRRTLSAGGVDEVRHDAARKDCSRKKRAECQRFDTGSSRTQHAGDCRRSRINTRDCGQNRTDHAAWGSQTD